MLRRKFLSLFAALPFAGLFGARALADPGNMVKLVSAGAETRTLAAPKHAGLTAADIDEFVEMTHGTFMDEFTQKFRQAHEATQPWRKNRNEVFKQFLENYPLSLK